MSWIRLSIWILLTGMFSGTVFPEIRFDATTSDWQLVSGKVEYVLQKKGGTVSLKYFGETAGPAWPVVEPAHGSPGRYDLDGQVEGETIDPAGLTLISDKTSNLRPGVDQLTLVFTHKRIPLTLEADYVTWGETGVITRALIVRNTGTGAIHIQHLPSLNWALPPGQYDLSYLWGGWSQERQLGNEVLGPGAHKFVSSAGRSTNDYPPWFCLHNRDNGERYLAQLAYSGNWEMSFDRQPLRADERFTEKDLNVNLGMQFDFAGALKLDPVESFQLPAVAFTSSGSGLDEAANQMHRYQRSYAFARNPANDPPLVQFNSWYPFPGKMTVEEMKRCAELAAKMGAEVFVLDAGWYNKKNWSTELGDYQADPVAFPKGIQELADYVRHLGMKFGIWVEIENVGIDSQIFRDHPDWCLKYNGAPIRRDERLQLDFSKPEVRQWARSVIDRLVHEYGIEWLKIDYNIEIGNAFDPPASDLRRGDALYRQVVDYYSWLDEVRGAFPDLIIENCASGGLRFDSGIMAHTNTTWLSDEVRPRQSLQLAYGCTLEFTPAVCNHWMVGDTIEGKVLPADSPHWWDFMFRVPMNGQFGISSQVFDWPPDLLRHAADNVARYKQIREVISNGDVYHLTQQPDHNSPVGWMAIQYITRRGEKSVLLAYRMVDDDPVQMFQLRGLDPNANYHVSGDQQPPQDMTGDALMNKGISVALKEPWSATIIELQQIMTK